MLYCQNRDKRLLGFGRKCRNKPDSMNTYFVNNVTIVNPDHIFAADVLIRGKVVESIASPNTLTVNSDVIIDGTGQYLIPLGVDPHVHLNLPTPAGPSCDNFELGGRAAIAGGTGALIDFVTPARGESLIDAFLKRKKESESCPIPVKLHVGVTWWSKSVEEEITTLVNDYGVKSFKIYLAYRETIGLSFEELTDAMKCIRKNSAVVAIHAEEGDKIKQLRQEFVSQGNTAPRYHALTRPAETEYNAVKKVIDIVRDTQCTTYLVHMSTAESVAFIREAKNEGLPLFAETCPQYLLLDDSVYSKPEPDVFAYIISPPIRTKVDTDALWEGLADGTIDCVSTDHCPFTLAQKLAGKDDFTKIPNGAGGIKHRMSLLFTYGVLQKRISLEQWVRLTSTNAAKIFGFEHFGKIETGLPANLVLWQPEGVDHIGVSNSLSNANISIYNNFEIAGYSSTIIQNK